MNPKSFLSTTTFKQSTEQIPNKVSFTSNELISDPKSSKRFSKFCKFRETQMNIFRNSLVNNNAYQVKYKPDPRYESINKSLYPDNYK